MANAGSLSVSIFARTARFSKGLRRVRRELAGFVGRVTSLGSVLSGIALGGGLGVFLTRTMEAMDNTAKLSDQIGVSAETLIGYGHAAKLAGVEQSVLSASLIKFQKSIGAAEQGSLNQIDALARIGITWQQLKAMSPAEQLSLVADRFGGLSNQIDRVTVLTTLFGKSGLKMATILANGSAGLREATEEAAKLGISFSRIDAAKVELANDSISRVRDVIFGIGVHVAPRLSAVLLEISDRFLGVATSGEGMGVRVNKALDGVTERVSLLIAFLDRLQLGLETVKYFAMKGAQLLTWRHPMAGKLGDLLIGRDNSGPLEAIRSAWGDKAMEHLNKATAIADRIRNGQSKKDYDDFMDHAEKRQVQLAKDSLAETAAQTLAKAEYEKLEAVYAAMSRAKQEQQRADGAKAKESVGLAARLATEFQQIDLSRINIAERMNALGVSLPHDETPGSLRTGKRGQDVHDAQLGPIGGTLLRMEKKLGGKTVAVAG